MTTEEMLADILASLKALHAKQDILMTARSTPKEVLLAEKLHTPGNSLTVSDAMRLCNCSRPHALNLMRNLEDKEPGKYKFMVGDQAYSKASRLIRRAGKEKQIDFMAELTSKGRVSLNQLATELGLTYAEVLEQASSFCAASERKNKILGNENFSEAWLMKN